MLQFDCIFSVFQRENTAKPDLSKGSTCILPAKTSVIFHGVDPKIRDLPMNQFYRLRAELKIIKKNYQIKPSGL